MTWNSNQTALTWQSSCSRNIWPCSVTTEGSVVAIKSAWTEQKALWCNYLHGIKGTSWCYAEPW
jgi:hypothetical protein